LSLLAGLALIPFVPRGLIPRLNRGEFKIVYQLQPTGLAPADLPSLPEKSREAAIRLEKFARSFREVATVYTLIGTREGDPTRGVLYVRLGDNRSRHTVEIEDAMRSSLPHIEQVLVSVEDVPFIELGDQKPIEFALVGDDWASVSKTAAALAARLKKEAGFVDVTSGASDALEVGSL